MWPNQLFSVSNQHNFQFQFFHFSVVRDTKIIHSIHLCKKKLCRLWDMYLTSASQSLLDNLCNGALMNSQTLQSSHILVHWQPIGHPRYDGLSPKVIKFCSKQLSVLKNIVLLQLISLFAIGIRWSIVHMILDMLFAPHDCCWAKYTIGKSLWVHFQIPCLVHTHPSIFGGKRFI